MLNSIYLSEYDSLSSEVEIFKKVQLQLMNRYDVDEKLASEMAWDLIDVLSAVDSNKIAIEKFFLQ